MPRKEGKSRSSKKPLREITNVGKSSKQPPVEDAFENGGQIEDDALDRLLLVQSHLSSLIRQIDELVVRAIQVKGTNHQGKKEVESFTNVLSDMICSLKPWVPRFQKALACPQTKAGKQLDQDLESSSIPFKNENVHVVESPENNQVNTFISPSPFVSWRAGCSIDRGRQLFLLTPLPTSKVLSSKRQDSHKSIFERVASNAHFGQSFCTISEGISDNLLEGMEATAIGTNLSEPGGNEVCNTSECMFDSPPRFPERDCSVIAATPCLKMSPPKSCVLLEPISKSSHLDNIKMRKATPYPRGVKNCNDDLETSESPTHQVSKSLAFKYPELFGIQPADKLGYRRKEVDALSDWFMSPPKTCVLMEPPNDSLTNTYCRLPRTTTVLNQQTNLPTVERKDFQSGCQLINQMPNQDIGLNSVLVECTPMCKGPESTLRTGKHPGETTLKRELWTRFEAASSGGLHFNTLFIQQTTQKGFLDRLDEASCEEMAPMALGL